MSSKQSGRRWPALKRRALGVAAGCVLAPGAFAAELPPTEAPDVVAPFARYQPWREAPLADWREANARVREIGGWRTYLREAQQNDNASGGHHAH